MTPPILSRDGVVTVAALAIITALAGAYTVFGVGMEMSALEMTAAAGTDGMAGMAMRPAAWSAGYAALVFLMWWVMMIAMMTPSAAPMILLFAAIKRGRMPEAEITALSLVFLLGYLLVWAAFSAVATALQWALGLGGLVSAMDMAATSATLGGLILIAAGLYQLTPLKHACLEHCRSPAHFLSHHHRPGRAGALRLGIRHGAFCVGCCWLLMALLFVGGIMNLYWIAGLMLVVLAEKLAPRGDLVARVTGVALAGAGAWLLIGG